MAKKQAKEIIGSLNENMYEREQGINLAFLSSIAGESIFLLGPPGVAKSLIARKMKHVYKDAKAFEYLMSRFSTPDEVFGPVSIKQLKDNDTYRRLTDSYLPGANVVFLDEIWKAGPAIQNTLLTVINEKIYRNGEEEMEVDLRSLIAASNELPAKGEGLEALWDRFIIRLYVGGIKDIKNFNSMITDTKDPYIDNVPEKLKITGETNKEWQKEIDKVEIGREVLKLIEAIRKRIAERNDGKDPEEKVIVSDRRWKKIIKLLRTSAFLHEREKVELIDCFIIPYCLWNKRDQLEEMENLVRETLQKRGELINVDLDSIEVQLRQLKREIDDETKYTKEITEKVPKEYQHKDTEVLNTTRRMP